MSAPQSRLSIPEIPGYHLHWFMDREGRIERAKQAGYEFVTPAEARPQSRLLGSDPLKSGNTDLGDRVSIAAGGEGLRGQPGRLYLMKIKQEYWEEDQKALEARADSVRDSLLGDGFGAEKDSPTDRSNRYVDRKRTQVPEFFRKKTTFRRP
jgi:hypothetical protein